MAQLVRPTQPVRVSQRLPSVKCSNCNNDVALQELADHVCQRPPPVPTHPKLSTFANSVNAFLPTRLQNRSPGPDKTIQQPNSPPRSFDASNRKGSNSPAPKISLPQPQSILKTSQTTYDNPRPRMNDPYNTAQSRTPEPRITVSDERMNSPHPANNILPPGNYVPRPPRIVNSPGLSPRPDYGSRQRTPSPLSPPTTPADTLQPPRHSPLPQNRDPRQQQHHPIYSTTLNIPPPPPEPDTKIGGVAGMAGVGRRGFAAAARAAMLANNAFSIQDRSGGYDMHNGYMTRDGMSLDVRTGNAPRLDINLATRSSSRGGTTPSLSPASINSTHSSPFPHSPYDNRGNRSPSSPRDPTPLLDKYGNRLQEENSLPYAISRDGSTNMNAIVSRSKERPYPVLSSLSSGSGSEYTPGPSVAHDTPLSPNLQSEYGGLAYADSAYNGSDGEPENRFLSPPPEPTSVRGSLKSPPGGGQSSATRSPFDISGNNKGRAPVKKTTLDSTTSGSTIYLGHGRDMSDDSVSVSDYSRATALDGAMRKLFSDDNTTSSHSNSTSSKSSRQAGQPGSPDQTRHGLSPSTVQTSPSPSPILSSKPLPSPVRAGNTVEKKEKRARKPKVCVRCEKQIQDGKWVQVDGGRVLCEKCWKNMYLPKCRRCNLPIEKQAVSSSDGQLKGKYHRDCFNCNTCHKPFPDKSFYVFDGKPLCAYHYHEANDSLCAAATCGQPIEGPCAVSHVGDRYHPHHLLCEHPGHPKCVERLEEYYEVDGRMLCERHANMAGRHDDEDDEDDDDDERWRGIKATKRRTKFLNLGEIGELE